MSCQHGGSLPAQSQEHADITSHISERRNDHHRIFSYRANSGLSIVQDFYVLYCYKSCKLRHTDVSEKVKGDITKEHHLERREDRKTPLHKPSEPRFVDSSDDGQIPRIDPTRAPHWTPFFANKIGKLSHPLPGLYFFPLDATL